MTDAKCLYCDMLLTRTEREEGWCESCGKRLPASSRSRSAAPSAPRAAAPAASSPGSKVGMFFAVFALALVFGLFSTGVGLILTNGKGGHYFGGGGAAVGGAVARVLFRKRSDSCAREGALCSLTAGPAAPKAAGRRPPPWRRAWGHPRA